MGTHFLFFGSLGALLLGLAGLVLFAGFDLITATALAAIILAVGILILLMNGKKKAAGAVKHPRQSDKPAY